MGSGITLCSAAGAGRLQDNGRPSLYPESSWFRPTGQEAGGRDDIWGGLTDLEESNKSKGGGGEADWIQLTEAEAGSLRMKCPARDKNRCVIFPAAQS